MQMRAQTECVPMGCMPVIAYAGVADAVADPSLSTPATRIDPTYGMLRRDADRREKAHCIARLAQDHSRTAPLCTRIVPLDDSTACGNHAPQTATTLSAAANLNPAGARDQLRLVDTTRRYAA